MKKKKKKKIDTGMKHATIYNYIYAKYPDKYVWENSVDPDLMTPTGSGSTLLAILSVFLDTSKGSQTDW